MDNNIDTGDPWDLSETEPTPTSHGGGMNSLAEGTGLFNRARAERHVDPIMDIDVDEIPAYDPGPVPTDEPATAPADDQPVEEWAQSPGDLPLYEEAHVEYTAPPAAPPAAEQARPEAASVEPTADEAVDQALEELGSATDLSEPAIPDSAFDLIPPPPAADPTSMFDDDSDDGTIYTIEEPMPAELYEVTADAAPSHTPAGTAESHTPLIETEMIQDVAGLHDEQVEIQFGTPRNQEGSEQPTGKATMRAGQGAISRAVLLTTDSVPGASIAPVDIVTAVETVTDPGQVPAAVKRALDRLREAASDIGGDAVVAVTTEISPVGTAIIVVASGTAINLL